MCGLPTWIDIAIEPLEGESLRVTQQGKALAYQRCSNGRAPETARITPSPQQWREFLAVLEEIKLRHWQPQYTAEDGSADRRWYIEIVAPGLLINTSGHGAFPEGDAFPRFHAALQRLLCVAE
ncbi:MAG: hypothetical protein ACYDCO_11955 [Armatimonadota bacterium]